jgi:hypothetical protein
MRTPAYNEVGHREIGAGNAKKKRCANHILLEYGEIYWGIRGGFIQRFLSLIG